MQPTEILKSILTRDRRNLNILMSDEELKKPILPACDCCDIIEFIHIQDPSKEQPHAYTEGIRRYFVKAEKLVLVPAWTFEFLNVIRNIIVNKIGRFGHKDGHTSFLKEYPGAYQFMKLWEAGKFLEAEKLYSQNDGWLEILAFTQDAYVEKKLGKPIQTFNFLVRSGRFATLSRYCDSATTSTVDTVTYRLTLEQLQESRSQNHNRRQNEIDARSFAMIRWCNQQSSDFFITAVTASKDPLRAFYYAIDEEQSVHAPPFSLARSPITSWIGERVNAIAGSNTPAHLDRGIHIIDELLCGLESLGDQLNFEEHALSKFPTDQVIKWFRFKGQLVGLLEAYIKYYRNPIFRPIEEYECTWSVPRPLTIEEAAGALDANKFQSAMKHARQNLQNQALETIERVEPFIRTGQDIHLSGRSITDLLIEIEKDFKREVY